MKRIQRRSANTPSAASFVTIASRTSRVLTLEYLRANGTVINDVPYSARIVTEETYQAMVKAPKEPTGKAETDPRRKDQDRRKDLPHGRNTTKSEDEELDRFSDPEDLADLDKTPEVAVKKRAKPTVGSATGKGADTERMKMKTEANDGDVFSYHAILRAMSAAQIAKEDIEKFIVSLTQYGPVRSEKKTTSFTDLVRRLSEAPFNGPAADPADAAQANFEADYAEDEESTDTIKVGMSQDDLGDYLTNISKNDIDTIRNLPRGTKIKLIDIENGAVTKVVVTSLIKTPEVGGAIIAKVSVNGKTTELTIGRGNNIYLKQDEQSGQYVLVKDSREDKPPKINFQGQ